MRFVCVLLYLNHFDEPKLPSNGLLFDDPSGYSTLLESLQELRYKILSHRNDRVPINRIPVEIFTPICQLTLPSDTEFAIPDNRRVFCVMKLMHVCRRWRSVLVSSPVLWTSFHVVKTTPKFIGECLQRSRKLPIHVSFKWDSSDPDYGSTFTGVAQDDGSVASNDGDNLNCINELSSSKPGDSDDGASSHTTLSVYPDHCDADYSWTAYIKEAQGYYYLMQHSHRIATLDISLPAPGDHEDEEDSLLACGLLFYPFPALQTLKLRCFLGSHGSIPKVILDEHITTVNNLLLENIPPTQIADLSLNLTSLTLRTTGHDTPIDASSFFRFLERSRDLRSLTLDNYNFLPVPNSTAPFALISLRQLDVFTDSATFLRHLVAPPLGPQSSFRLGEMDLRFSLSAENSTSGTSASVSCLALSAPPDPGELQSLISDVFGSGWGEATQLTVVIPIGGPEPKFVDQFLDCLTGLSDLSMERSNGRVNPWFDSCGLQRTLSKA